MQHQNETPTLLAYTLSPLRGEMRAGRIGEANRKLFFLLFGFQSLLKSLYDGSIVRFCASFDAS
ncbi:MAG: hypothetical protein NT023_13545, partial [Armatimonadetes bacterium]|nr:hypothetical protein [Armatimonadota bacterium]